MWWGNGSVVGHSCCHTHTHTHAALGRREQLLFSSRAPLNVYPKLPSAVCLPGKDKQIPVDISQISLLDYEKAATVHDLSSTGPDLNLNAAMTADLHAFSLILDVFRLQFMKMLLNCPDPGGFVSQPSEEGQADVLLHPLPLLQHAQNVLL